MSRQLETRRRSPETHRRALLLGLALCCALALPGLGGAETQRLLPSGSRSAVHLDSRNGGLVRELGMEKGKSVLLTTEWSVKRVSVGDAEIVDVVVLGGRELQLVAKKIGETNVVLWDSSGRPKVAIDVAVGRPYAAIESELRRVIGNDNLRIESAGESIVLKGSVADAASMDRAMRVAKAFLGGDKKGKDRIINLLEVGGNQQVMIEVTIAEMSRQLTREMESNFSAMIQSGNQEIQIFNFLRNLISLDAGSATGDALLISDRVNLLGTFANVGSGNYAAALNFLQEKGLVKILAEPTLVARSGQSASFLAGGEVPIPIAQGGAFGSITIEFKQFGVLVAFTPTVMGNDRIHLEVTPEVSEPDFTLGAAVSGFVIPGFTTRRASTGVELGDGQAFAIAGLLRDDVRELAAQYPLLGDIPVLGTLFRSKQYQKNETELVLMVRPRLVKPLPPGPQRLPTDDFVEPGPWEFYLTNALEGGASPEARAGARAGLLGAAGHRLSITGAEKELR